MNYGDFKILDKVRKTLPPEIFHGGPWMHYGTVLRGLREYVVLLHIPSHKIYIEEITPSGEFKKVQDESLWKDLVFFCTAKGLTGEAVDREVIVKR